jgi:hypothetical protein
MIAVESAIDHLPNCPFEIISVCTRAQDSGSQASLERLVPECVQGPTGDEVQWVTELFANDEELGGGGGGVS